MSQRPQPSPILRDAGLEKVHGPKPQSRHRLRLGYIQALASPISSPSPSPSPSTHHDREGVKPNFAQPRSQKFGSSQSPCPTCLSARHPLVGGLVSLPCFFGRINSSACQWMAGARSTRPAPCDGVKRVEDASSLGGLDIIISSDLRHLTKSEPNI